MPSRIVQPQQSETPQSIRQKSCAVIGGGPAGMMAAETLAHAGCAVTIYERMPTLGRKFLMAGIGGLNLTHTERFERFVARYRGDIITREMLEEFGSDALRTWCAGLGEETFAGSSGRVFPTSFKASPLLRAWLRRTSSLGVDIQARWDWIGWGADTLLFNTPLGPKEVKADGVIMAMGGASWPRLGSNGAWFDIFEKHDIASHPFQPSNCGFVTGWHEHVGEKFAGTPLKSVEFLFDGQRILGEAIVTRNGIEGGGIYALSGPMRDAITKNGEAVLNIDLKPGVGRSEIAEKLKRRRSGDSLSNSLRKLGLSPAAIAVLREGYHPLPTSEDELASAIKSVPVILRSVAGIERAISTAGGVAGSAVNESLMLVSRPGVFVAGEMLDWEAPTGGYLMHGCLATGRWAARGLLEWMR